MSYNPTTDFLALWRNNGSNVSKLEMPGLDYIIAGLARAGVIVLSVSATAPVANQPTTAWLQTAVPSNSGEGTFNLWNPVTAAYAPATPALFLDFLQASAGQSGVSWWTTTGGAPLNTVGNNGDYAIRTDAPGGVYGPKAAGAWPAAPLPGTTNTIASSALDNTFGTVEGSVIYRGAALWQALAPGAINTVLSMVAGPVPAWNVLSTLLDAVFSNVQGSVLYRDVGAWAALAPGTAGYVLQTLGLGANPSWQPKSSEFLSGTVLVFYQGSAPTGWTKQTAVNDAGLRVVSGTGGVFNAGSAFSTVFAQTVTGNHTLVVSEMPSHAHAYVAPSLGSGTGTSPNYFDSATTPGTTSTTGGDGAHNHTISLQLSYADVIIAQKN